MFQIAVELVTQSSRNIFLTGKAGTGKTTFLKFIREHSPKRMAVTAPTGVAAINAGAVTLHSFFQLPLASFIPESKGVGVEGETVNKHSLLSRLRMNSEKKKLLQELELLIIDEISMVRADTLDAVDTILRHIRNRHHEVFGGVQLLFIGDMFQLPPVVRNEEWALLSTYYESPYFFDSNVIRQDIPLYIEFDKIYRQSEGNFIRLLNQVRNNELDEDSKKMLESRYDPDFAGSRHEGYIILTTHNDTARQINNAQLSRLENKTQVFKAAVEGEFPPGSYPADEDLELKIGAQVMFIKNDTDKGKRYYNGKIGVITYINDDRIYVQCKDDPQEIEVKKDSWENIRYSLDNTTRSLEEKVLGSFSQFPLRLAWAITIHKSQGLTFEKAIIDAGRSFAAGQVYVALSRCTKLEGIVLHSKINNSSLQTDPRIVAFSKKCAAAQQLETELQEAREAYRVKLLLSLFDYTREVADCNELVNYVLEHAKSFEPADSEWPAQLLGALTAQLETGKRFQSQLLRIIGEKNDSLLVERINAAATHFLKEINGLVKTIQQSPLTTDSRNHAKEYNDLLRELLAGLSMKKHLLEIREGVLDTDTWHKRRNSFSVPVLQANAYAGSTQKTHSEVLHPQLQQQLRKYRDSICEAKGIPLYLVAGTQTILEMANYLPHTLDELSRVSGFGPAKIKSYGQQFLDIIITFCGENGYSSRIDQKPVKSKRKSKEPSTTEEKPKKPAKPDTKDETFQLFKSGMQASAIARHRNLTVQTIEGHLAHYVQAGSISIQELLSAETIQLIERALEGYEGGAIIPIKQQLGDNATYGEIRMVIAWKEHQKQLLG